MNQTLEIEDDLWHEALQEARIGLWVADVASEEVEFDSLCGILFAVEPVEVTTYRELLGTVIEEDRQLLDASIKKVLCDRRSLDVAVRIRLHDGSIRWLALQGKVHDHYSGNDKKIIGIATDISLHKARDMRMEDTIANLMLANRELDAFSSSVAHDLKAPLAALAGFSDMLRDECGSGVSEKGCYYFRKVKDIVHQMDSIINNLLFMAHVTAPDIVKARVPLEPIARSIIDDLKKKEPGRAVDVRIQPDLCGNADANLITIVLTNLLGNAWKFTGMAATPEIEFGCSKANNRSVYFVRDNGVGFDMKEAHRLFKPMQRLYTAQKFEGTGIGLALANRIIKKHGGSMWTESEQGKGATFYFTLE